MRRGEEVLVASIARKVPRRRAVEVGIGDDAAVVRMSAGRYAWTTDTLVETVDFLPEERPYWIGRRAAAANLSDLAAMGARPLGYLLSLAFPPSRGVSYGRRIAEGVISKMEGEGALLWGGDLSGAPQTVVTIALVGDAPWPVLRTGARAGDLLFATGTPGLAARGLQERRVGRAPRQAERAFLDPQPRVRFARALARERIATAMIDISDGLGRDAGRLAAASRVRVELRGVSREAIVGGDDFELLFSAPEARWPRIRRIAVRTSTPVFPVGLVRRGKGAVWIDGSRVVPVSGLGFDHFAR
jgi:thiamine-monophosphate kinase